MVTNVSEKDKAKKTKHCRKSSTGASSVRSKVCGLQTLF